MQITESDAYIAICGLYDHCRDITAKPEPTDIDVRIVEQYLSVVCVMRAELVAIGWSQFDYAQAISDRLTRMIERREALAAKAAQRIERLEQLGLIRR